MILISLDVLIDKVGNFILLDHSFDLADPIKLEPEPEPVYAVLRFLEPVPKLAIPVPRAGNPVTSILLSIFSKTTI